MNNLTRRLPALVRQGIRNSATAEVYRPAPQVKPVPPGYREGINPDLRKLKALQAQLQANKDVPVHLKRGGLDYVFWYYSVGITFYAIATTPYLLYLIWSVN